MRLIAGRMVICILQKSALVQALLDGRNIITTPTIVLPIPPNSSHKVLFVGAPVKIREIPELAESEALQP
jgi:hypothetical protein